MFLLFIRFHRWVKDFIGEGGTDILFSILYRFSLKRATSAIDHEIQSYSIRALKALMNNMEGLNAVIESSEGVSSIAMAYSSPVMKIKTIVLELLAAVALIPPNGHERVLQAMQKYKEEFNENRRFETLVSHAMETEHSEGDQHISYIDHKVQGSPIILRLLYLDLSMPLSARRKN